MKVVVSIVLFFMMQQAPAQSDKGIYDTHYIEFKSQGQSLKMAYRYEKAKNPNGKTLILLHGKNFSGIYWEPFMEHLLIKGYNVLVPDQIGFGESSMPQRYQYTFQQLAINTKQLADKLAIKNPVILGHSMGGMLAIRYALMYPENCRQLILEDPIGLEDWKRVVPYSSIDNEYINELKKTPETVKKYFTENYFHNEWKSSYNNLLTQSTKQLGDSIYAWSMALTSDMIFTQPVCYEFENIKVPTALIIGTLDKTAIGKERVNAEVAEKLGNYVTLGKHAASMIPKCRYIPLTGIGHIPHIENLSLFINAINTIL